MDTFLENKILGWVTCNGERSKLILSKKRKYSAISSSHRQSRFLPPSRRFTYLVFHVRNVKSRDANSILP